MTKAECVIEEIGFFRVNEDDFQEKKHDGNLYTVRVWHMQNRRGVWKFFCDSYYGRAKLFLDGNYMGDFECIYEEIPRVVSARSEGIPA